MARRVKGVDKVLRNLQRVAEGIPAGAIKGVEDVALDLLGKAASDAPVDTGDLRGSGYARIDGQTMAVGMPDGGIAPRARSKKVLRPLATVGFGEKYAYIQHENRHFRHPRGGKAGYLMDNLRANEQRYKKHIIKKATEALK